VVQQLLDKDSQVVQLSLAVLTHLQVLAVAVQEQ
jgi:hypothetical protein